MSDRPWWSHVLQWSLWFAVMYAVMGWLNRMRSKPRPASAARTLAHPISTLVLGGVCTAFFVGIAVLAHVYARDPAPWWATAIFLALALSGGAMILDYYMARHEVSDEGLAYRKLTGARGFMRWHDVRRVRFASTLKWFKLESESGQIARISVMLMGLPEFAQLLLAHAPESAFDADSLALLESTAAGSPPSVWV